MRTITSSEVPPGFEPGNKGFADPCLTTWPRHRTSSPAYLAQTQQKAASLSPACRVRSLAQGKGSSATPEHLNSRGSQDLLEWDYDGRRCPFCLASANIN